MNGDKKKQVLLDIQKHGVSFLMVTLPKGSGKVVAQHVAVKDLLGILAKILPNETEQPKVEVTNDEQATAAAVTTPSE